MNQEQHRGIQIIDQEKIFTDKSHTITILHDQLPAPLPVKNDLIQFSFSCWYKPTAINHNGWSTICHKVFCKIFIIKKGDAIGQRTPGVWMYHGRATLSSAISYKDGTSFHAETAQSLDMQKWTHFAYVLFGNTLLIYVNGIVSALQLLNNTVEMNTWKLCIGGDAWHDPANGSLKHFRWYNFALGHEQVQQDMISDTEITGVSNSVTSHFVADYANMLKDAATSDIILIVAGKPIPAHKVILKHRSEYFAMLFASGMKEAEETQVEIDSKNPSVFLTLLEYIYSGQLRLKQTSAEDVFELYQECNKYLLHDAEHCCLNHLQEHIKADVQYAVQVLAPSFHAGHTKIKQLCFAKIVTDFASIVKSNTFFTWPQDLQSELLLYVASQVLAQKSSMK